MGRVKYFRTVLQEPVHGNRDARNFFFQAVYSEMGLTYGDEFIFHLNFCENWPNNLEVPIFMDARRASSSGIAINCLRNFHLSHPRRRGRTARWKLEYINILLVGKLTVSQQILESDSASRVLELWPNSHSKINNGSVALHRTFIFAPADPSAIDENLFIFNNNIGALNRCILYYILHNFGDKRLTITETLYPNCIIQYGDMYNGDIE